jgi:hypothetical protein
MPLVFARTACRKVFTLYAACAGTLRYFFLQAAGSGSPLQLLDFQLFNYF